MAGSDKGVSLRATTILLSLVSLLLTGAFSLSLTQPAQPAAAQPVPWHPRAQIRAACIRAGFVPKGAKMGVGIALDCIQPIMVGTPQRKQASQPLPLLDPQVVAACKERNPNFGMGGGQPLFSRIAR
jgi:hypothetical protein